MLEDGIWSSFVTDCTPNILAVVTSLFLQMLVCIHIYDASHIERIKKE